MSFPLQGPQGTRGKLRRYARTMVRLVYTCPETGVVIVGGHFSEQTLMHAYHLPTTIKCPGCGKTITLRCGSAGCIVGEVAVRFRSRYRRPRTRYAALSSQRKRRHGVPGCFDPPWPVLKSAAA